MSGVFDQYLPKPFLPTQREIWMEGADSPMRSFGSHRMRAMNVDLTSAGPYSLGVVPNGFMFIPMTLIVQCLDAPNVSSVATITIGFAGPNYNQIMGETFLAGLDSPYDTYIQPATNEGAGTSILGGVEIFTKVTTFAIDPPQTANIILFGIFIPQ